MTDKGIALGKIQTKLNEANLQYGVDYVYGCYIDYYLKQQNLPEPILQAIALCKEELELLAK